MEASFYFPGNIEKRKRQKKPVSDISIAHGLSFIYAAPKPAA